MVSGTVTVRFRVYSKDVEKLMYAKIAELLVALKQDHDPRIAYEIGVEVSPKEASNGN